MTQALGNTAREEEVQGAGGLNMFVRSWRPDTKARGVVVICHGVNSHSGYYTWAAEQLVAGGLAVYALDLHGRGKSDGERFYLEQIGDYLSDVDAVVTLAKSRDQGLPCSCSGTALVASCRASIRSSIRPSLPD